MRIPHFGKLIPTPNQAVSGIARQAAGVVILGVAQKYVPNTWARWGVYVVAGALGFWYPLTRAVLTATHLDDFIEDLGD